MPHQIERKYYRTGIVDFTEEVRAYLAGALVDCAEDRTVDLITSMILATRDGNPLPSWRLNPRCLLEDASPAFLAAYPDAVRALRKQLSPREAYIQKLPLKEMIAARLTGLSPDKRRNFLHMALSQYTDYASLFNFLRFCHHEVPAFCDSLCRHYGLDRRKYQKRLAEPARKAVEVRNVYVAHATNITYRDMTPDQFVGLLNVLLAPAIVLSHNSTDTASLRADRDAMDHAVHCRPLPLAELEQNVPNFDEAHLTLSCFSTAYDVKNGVLYLHSLQEVQDELFAFCQSFDSAGVQLARTEAQSDSIPPAASTRPILPDTDFSRSPLLPLPHMQAYSGGHLTEEQVAEVVTRCNVLADASCWMSREGQRFITERVLPLQSSGSKKFIVDWATRVELYRTELDTQSQREQYARAHEARIVMSHLHHQGKIKYAPQRRGPRSSQGSLLSVLERNPGQMICLLTMDWDFCIMLARKAPRNVIPLLVGSNLGCMVHPKLIGLIRSNVESSSAGATPMAAPAAPAPASVTSAAATSAPSDTMPAVLTENQEPLPWTPSARGTVLHTGDGTEVRLDTKLAEGGEGEIFTTGDSTLVAKLYNKRHLTANRRDKLMLMLEKDPHIQGLCWPTALLFHTDDSFAGFLMPRIDPTYRELATSVLQLGKPRVQEQLTGWDRLALVRVCRQLCRLFDRLHHAGILLGDINPRNILVRLADPAHPKLAIVDCDSCQIGRYPCPVGTVLHTSPAIYKRLNTTNPRYGTFLRTPEDEDYAMTVLLFELLMLNQSPFSSKGITDLGQAVREGKFAYRFTPKNSSEAATDGSDTPDGPYRMIWGNMPYAVREGFFNTFAQGMPSAPAQWDNTLRSYEQEILSGAYTRDLTPTRYFDWDGTHTVDFICEGCGAPANMPRDRLESNQKYHRLNLCNACYSAMLRLLNDPTPVPVHCVNCHKVFNSNKWQATLEDRHMPERGRMRDRLCPDCRQTVSLTCSVCGKPFTMSKIKWENLSRRGLKPRCPDCLASHS